MATSNFKFWWSRLDRVNCNLLVDELQCLWCFKTNFLRSILNFHVPAICWSNSPWDLFMNIFLKCRFMKAPWKIFSTNCGSQKRQRWSDSGVCIQLHYTAVRLRYINAIRLDNLNSYSNDKIRKTSKFEWSILLLLASL